MDRDRYIKIIFYVSAALFSIVVLSSFMGSLPLEYIGFGGEVEERFGLIKYSLGFDGPNQTSFSFFTVLLSGLYTYGNKKIFAVVISSITIAIGVATGSRTGTICSILFIVCFLLIQNRGRVKQSKLLPFLFIICAVFSFSVVTVFANSQTVNNLLTNRPALINQYLNSNYIPRAFGSNEVYNKAEYQTAPLDNFPIYVLGRYGVIGFASIALIFYLAIRKELSPKIKCLFIFMMLYGMSEAFFDIPAKNFLLPIFLYTAIVVNNTKELSV